MCVDMFTHSSIIPNCTIVRTVCDIYFYPKSKIVIFEDVRINYKLEADTLASAYTMERK